MSKLQRIHTAATRAAVKIVAGALPVLWAVNAWAGDVTTSEAQREHSLPGGTLVVIAYMIFWAMIFAYLVVIVGKQKKLRHDLNELEHRINDVFDVEE